MNIIAQKAKERQAVVKWALRKGKSSASQMYGVSLSSVKRWCKRYDGTCKSLEDRSHRPHSHPKRHTEEEEQLILKCFQQKFLRYGWDGVYDEAVKCGYTRSFSGMVYAAKRMGLGSPGSRKPPRKHDRRYPELSTPGEKVQIDVKEVPYCCLRGELKENGKHLYQWTAIDECTRYRFIYGFDEHTPENTVKFFQMLQKAFPFKIQTVPKKAGRTR